MSRLPRAFLLAGLLAFVAAAAQGVGVVRHIKVLSDLGAGPAEQSADAPPAARKLAAVLQPFVDRHVLAGAVVLVADKGRVLAIEAVGYADIAAKRPMQTDCLFWIASMSKPMTAAALMMLADEGKVRLDDPVEKYLPEFQGQMLAVEQSADRVVLGRPAHPITVRELLSHTSGLPFMSRVEHKIDTFTLHEAAIGYALTPLMFQPGSKHVYSNAGINTAGRIIEAVSRMPYEEFMEKRLFRPLGMKDTTFWPSDEQLGRLAKSYRPNAGHDGLDETRIDQLTYPLNDRGRGPSPAGGYFSTARDVGNFCRMVLGGGVFEGRRLISARSVAEMTATQTADILDHGKGEGGYGLGWLAPGKFHGEAVAPTGACGHGGAYSTNLWIDPPRGLITVYMVQHAGYAGTDGGNILPSFTKAADEAFGKGRQ